MTDPKQALMQFGLLLRDYQKHVFNAGVYSESNWEQAQRETVKVNAKQKEIMEHFARSLGLIP